MPYVWKVGRNSGLWVFSYVDRVDVGHHIELPPTVTLDNVGRTVRSRDAERARNILRERQAASARPPKSARTKKKVVQTAKAKIIPVLCPHCRRPLPGQFAVEGKLPRAEACDQCAGRATGAAPAESPKHGNWAARHGKEETNLFKENRDGSGQWAQCAGCGQPLPLCQHLPECVTEQTARANRDAERQLRAEGRRGRGVPT